MSFVRSGAWNQFLGSIKSTWGTAKRTAKLTGATLFSERKSRGPGQSYSE